ncbi:hypothetical protein QYE76_009061 [Lolium multiflorum]|uniref:F-box domain-containing protein n=1 Tax=Lolium multiflorum TaxID=4521 RepID=A0AAD8TUN4_LOLMU|nr:hypothetical protein QYE76_009061 [Lolium multiflorum]
MANQQQDDGTSSSSQSLPDDVVTEILAYLPAKSVGRLRCVSRSWRAMLSTALFVKLHLRRANDKPKIFFSPTKCDSDNDYQFYAWQPGCAAPVTKLMRNDFSRPAVLTRPLHGLVLLRCVGEGGYFLCNPSTGEVRPLPDSRAPLKLGSHLPFCYFKVVYGFGYCSASNEYKAVRIFSDEMDGAAPSCEVFVLNGDTPAYWRPAVSQPPMCVLEEENPAVFLHGQLHFLYQGDGDILTFDVGNETFGWLPQPRCPPGKAPLRTTELDGCLCVFRGDGYSRRCHVWLLRDYAARRWKKICCIDPTAWPDPEKTLLRSCWIAPLGIIYSGDNGSQKKIVFGTGTCVVFMVDLYGGGVLLPDILFKPNESIPGDFDDTYNYPAIGIFEESLVTLGNYTEDTVFSSPVTKAWSDVLKWLPARSVLQASLVSREWRAMVTTDRFIRSHAAVHARSTRVMFVSDPIVGSFTDLEDHHVNQPHLLGNRGLFRCSQPCHGLNLGSWNLRDYLYNPTTRYLESVHVEVFERDASFAGRIALGYDYEIDDHVMVSLDYEKKNMETRYYNLHCHVRSLRGSWDLVNPPPRPVAIDVMPAYSNGKIYWVVEPKLGPCSAVSQLVAFNTWDREFEVLQGSPCSNFDSRRVSIVELYDTICMACYDEDKNAIDIWRMKDDDGAWCVECRIELEEFSPEYSSQRTTLLSSDPVDGRILLNTGWSLGYYDPKAVTLETIYTVGEGGGDFGFCPVIVQDSLVRPFMK